MSEKKFNLDTVEHAAATPNTELPWAELGLKENEFEDVKKILGRRPTAAELAMYSVMWSEHCSYKSSKVHLKQFGVEVTDEAMAMERLGLRPLLVEGADSNFKITTRADLERFEFELSRRT